MSNNWELCSDVIYRDITALYYLKCNMCGRKKCSLEKELAIMLLVLKAASYLQKYKTSRF